MQREVIEIRNIFNISVLILLLLIAGCAGQKSSRQPKPPEPIQSGKLRIVVSIVPQAYFVKRIAGDLADITVLVSSGPCPEMYEPTPKQIEEISRSQVFFTIGLPFEKVLVQKIIRTYPEYESPELDLVDTSEGIQLREIESHVHAGVEKSETGMKDPHIWLSPKLVKIQAETIANELGDIDPSNKETYTANLASFIADLDALDVYIKDKLKNLKKREFLVFHPTWGYFADDYNLKQIPIEMEGKEPSAKELEEIIEFSKKENIRTIFVERQASSKSAESIATHIDGRVMRLNPFAYDYIKNLEDVATIFSEVLQ